jgi:2-polyprenyl-3-methyl-5-hydroxy-6-metoxy-1,4-benzoquinol methylase
VTSSSEDEKFKIESINKGVHEFIKSVRTHAYTKKFLGDHPKSIKKRIKDYKERIMSEIKKDNQCWDNPDIYQHMLDGAEGKIFNKLEYSDHWPTLKSLLDLSSESGSKKLCDLGCGAASLAEIYKDMEYTGSDLDHIIDNVAQKFYPEGNFIKSDIKTSDLQFLNNFDCILLNGLIEVVENPIECLDRILKNAKHQVIVHRQCIGNETKSWLIPSYGGMDSYRSQFSEKDVNDLLVKHGFKVIQLLHIPQLDQYSFLIEKN